jgi:hypothetical protein
MFGEVDNQECSDNTIKDGNDSGPDELESLATPLPPVQKLTQEATTPPNDYPVKDECSTPACPTANPSAHQKHSIATASPTRRGSTVPRSPAPPENPAVVEAPVSRINGRTLTNPGDPDFEGVFEIERLLEKQWSGKILWLKIKWKGIAKGSWEKADHIKEDLGEEGYQELLETKPRKKRKKASKW